MVSLRGRIIRLERKALIQHRRNEARAEIARREKESSKRLAKWRRREAKEAEEAETKNTPSVATDGCRVASPSEEDITPHSAIAQSAPDPVTAREE